MNPNRDRRVKATPGGAVSPWGNPLLWLVPRELLARIKDFFIYSAEFLPLAAGATTAVTTQIQGDSDFLVVQGVRTCFAVDNTTVVANPPAMVRISDTGSGRDFMDRAVHIENLFGTAQLPAVWPFPKLLPANSTLSTQLQNLDGATARNYRLSYVGFKIFRTLQI